MHCPLPLWSYLGLFKGLLEVTCDLSFYKSKTILDQIKMENSVAKSCFGPVKNNLDEFKFVLDLLKDKTLELA